MQHHQTLPSLFCKIRKSKFRYFIWPIHSSELIKFLPMALLMFMILLNQNLVRSMKDSIVMTMIGPEVISFIKLCVEMPIGILFVLAYTKMCNVISTEQAFRYIISLFLIYFVVFVFVIFPNREMLHPSQQKIFAYVSHYPHLKWFITLWAQWSLILFYVMGELWPTIVFSLLFWQLANKITTTEEASRFYSFFSLFGQSNLLISGSIIVYFTQKDHFLSKVLINHGTNLEVTLKIFCVIITISGICCLLLHKFVEHTTLSNINNALNSKNSEPLKLSLIDSLKMILSSRYLGLICVMIISYSMTVNLIEGLWLTKAKQIYNSTTSFMGYQGKVLFYTGICTLFCSVLGGSIIRYLGWFWGAVSTPLVFIVVGCIFFIGVLLQPTLEALLIKLGLTMISPLFIIVIIGGLQNILGKGVKYSLFDATKEMVYIPLNDEMKTKGKAAVDVIGAKIGKSSGAIIQFVTFTIFPNASYDNIAGFLLITFIIILLIWTYSTYNLSKAYNQLLSRNSTTEQK